jgi:hypothetical protein
MFEFKIFNSSFEFLDLLAIFDGFGVSVSNLLDGCVFGSFVNNGEDSGD